MLKELRHTSEKPPGLTLVLNPHARKPKLRALSLEDLQEILGPNCRIHVTQDLEQLDQLMSSWSNEDETICFYGGDGSISRGITSLIRHQGESFELPPILTVRAGTMNMMCSVLGFRESVRRTLHRWCNHSLVELRSIPTLKVEVEGQLPFYGFVFAWGVGYRVLKQYYQRSSTPDVVDAMAVLTQAFLQGLNADADLLPMFKREILKLRVDGEDSAAIPMHTLTVGTIPRLSLGIRPFPPAPITPNGFHYSANGMPLAKVTWHSPTLLFGLGDQRKLQYGRQLLSGAGVHELECTLSEGFTMDGETFDLAVPARIRITTGPVVRFWCRSE